jgi:hypothetical protein
MSLPLPVDGTTKIRTFAREADRHEVLQQAASDAAATGPTVLLQGMQIERPIDVLKATVLTADDKRTILAAWASDFYAVDRSRCSAIFLEHRSRFPSMRFRLPSGT